MHHKIFSKNRKDENDLKPHVIVKSHIYVKKYYIPIDFQNKFHIF